MKTLLGFISAESFTGSGVYALMAGDEVLYIGASGEVERRVGRHKWRNIIPFTSVAVLPTEKYDLRAVERAMIAALRPKFNTLCNPDCLKPKEAKKQVCLWCEMEMQPLENNSEYCSFNCRNLGLYFKHINLYGENEMATRSLVGNRISPNFAPLPAQAAC